MNCANCCALTHCDTNLRIRPHKKKFLYIQVCRFCIVCTSLYWKLTLKTTMTFGPNIRTYSHIKKKLTSAPRNLNQQECQIEATSLIFSGVYSYHNNQWNLTTMTYLWLGRASTIIANDKLRMDIGTAVHTVVMDMFTMCSAERRPTVFLPLHLIKR